MERRNLEMEVIRKTAVSDQEAGLDKDKKEEEHENSDKDENPNQSSFIQTFLEGRARSVAKASFEPHNYTRGCHFSPDGLCLLLNSCDNILRLYEVDEVSALRICLNMRSNEALYDLKWYSLMNSANVDSCCFAATAMQQPIHLYDAYHGHIRASYRCFDHLDELVSARSLAFDCQGQRLIAGLKNHLRVFDVARPGRDCDQVATYSKSEREGQRGIISCLDTSPVLPDILAAGSFERGLAIYNLGVSSPLLCLLEGQKGGITHVKFNSDGSKVLAGGRKDDEILVWDLRNPGTLYCVLGRKARTNQTIFFDTLHSDLVTSASTDGQLLFYNLAKTLSSDQVTEPLRSLKMSNDCLNGVSLHPTLPALATCSGQRHVKSDSDDDNDDDKKENWESELQLWQFSALHYAGKHVEPKDMA